MKKDELTYNVIGCAMKVHSILGNGFQEVIYQRSLAIELDRAGLENVHLVQACLNPNLWLYFYDFIN
jgi:GxxExxY protein